MLELEHGFRVLDVHATLEPDDERRPRDGMGDPEALEREMHQAGVARAVVHAGEREDGYLKVNNAVARMTVGRPLDTFARINGARTPEGSENRRLHNAGARMRNVASRRKDHHTSPGDVEQYAYDDRFVGFTLHPPVDGLPDEAVLSELEAVDKPVLVHGGRGYPPDAIERQLLEYDFPVVVAHFGSYPLQRELMDEAIALLDRHDRCYLDSSVVRFREPMERAIMEHPDRVLFGSGAPNAHPNVSVMEILTLDVPEDAMRKAFANNPARVVEELAR